MAALTAPYDARRKDGELTLYGINNNIEVFKGGMAALAASGYVQAASDTAGVLFVGVFAESVSNLDGAVQPGQIQPAIGSPSQNTNTLNGQPVGAAGALGARVYKEGAFVFNKAAAVQSDLGKTALIVDDNTVSVAATTNNVACGKIVEIIDGSHVRVRIDLEVN